jgi:hypothetical protein
MPRELYMRRNARHSRFASHAIPPSVIFLTSRERPLRRLIDPWRALRLLSDPAWHQRLAGDGINQRPPKDRRGVYLFTERGKHLYVGRTGITTRSRASGGPPITSFRHRFDQHTQPGRPPGASSFASRLMRNAAKRRGIEIPSDWWKDRRAASAEAYGLFCAAKTRIGAMECRVVAFDDDLKGVRSSVAEIYVHAQLKTRFNDFSTS